MPRSLLTFRRPLRPSRFGRIPIRRPQQKMFSRFDDEGRCDERDTNPRSPTSIVGEIGGDGTSHNTPCRAESLTVTAETTLTNHIVKAWRVT